MLCCAKLNDDQFLSSACYGTIGGGRNFSLPQFILTPRVPRRSADMGDERSGADIDVSASVEAARAAAGVCRILHAPRRRLRPPDDNGAGRCRTLRVRRTGAIALHVCALPPYRET